MSKIMEKIEAVRPYWDSFWQGEVPMLSAVIPRNAENRVPKPALGVTHKTDIEALADSLLQWEAANEFVGGAIPFYCVYLFDFYNVPASFCGGKVEECGDSHRMIPFVDDLKTVELEFDARADIAVRLKDVVARLQDLCGDKILISASAIGGNLDALEAARGSSRLLMDLYDDPDSVHRCLKQIDKVIAQVLDLYAGLYDFETFGSVCRHGMYTRGRIGVPQCDFGYMISPDHFKEFALPCLRQEFARLDGVCYHLDGVGNLPNLEVLCKEPDLHVIQWVPGAGHGDQDWTHVWEKVDALGKGMMRRGTVEGFTQWQEKHSAPWQYWNIATESVEEFNECLKEFCPAC